MDKDMKPVVTIIMPVMNLDKYLRVALDSILTQTFKEWELIVVDDGSTDTTLKILEEYKTRDKRIILVKNEENLGLPKSLNKCIELAKGKYIARMDGDDISLPDRLEKQVHFLENNPKYVLVGSWADVIDENGEKTSLLKRPSKDYELRVRLLTNTYFVHGAVTMRTDALKKVSGYDASYRYAQDYNLWLRLMKQGKIANIPEVLYQWRSYSNVTNPNKLEEQANNVKRSQKELITLPKYLPEILMSYVFKLYSKLKNIRK